MIPTSQARGVAQLLGEALAEISKLVQTEFAIARLELAEKAGRVAGAAKLFAAGGVCALGAVIIILMAIAAGLMRAGLPDWAAYLCTGVGAAIIAFGLIMAGLNSLSPRTLAPSATLEELRQDRITARAIGR